MAVLELHEGSKSSLRVGDQYELVLDDVRSVVPWEGKSPRELTRAFQTFSLGAHPPGGPIRNG